MSPIAKLSPLARVASALLSLASVGAPALAQEKPGGHFRMYHQQRMDMAIDTTRVAVLAEAGGGADRARAGEQLVLAGLGVRAADAPIAGWFFLELAPGLSDGDVEKLTATIAARPGVEFVSPVFIESGRMQWIMPRLWIGYADGVEDAARDRIAALSGATLAQRNELPGVDRLTPVSRSGFQVLEAANRLAALADGGGVRFAEAGMAHEIESTLIPNDPEFIFLWGLNNTGQLVGSVAGFDVDGPEAWDVTTGRHSILIAVLDDGIQLDHPDLNLAPGIDLTEQGTSGGPANECDNHGTAVAGPISARINNNLLITGLAPTCRVLPIKHRVANVTTPCGVSGVSTDLWLTEALRLSAERDARIVNMSFVLNPSASFDTALQTARDAGLVLFSGTGNSGAGSIAYPASNANVIAVGSIDFNGARSAFSQFGPGTDIVAPGNGIRSTDRTGAAGVSPGDFSDTGGTSLSAPYAAATAALVLSRNPSLTPAQVETTLKSTAMDLGSMGVDDTFGSGLVRARAALDATAALNPPANDTCEQAIAVSTGTINGTLLNATPFPNKAAITNPVSCILANQTDVWYSFVSPGVGTVTVDTCGTHDSSGVDTAIAIYDRCNGTPLACHDDGNGTHCGPADVSAFRDAKVSQNVVAGQQVFIRVANRGLGAGGAFVMHVSYAVANDACASAIDASAGGQFANSLQAATNDGTASCGQSGTNPDVWYRFTAPCVGRLVVDTCGTHDSPGQDLGTDTVLSLYSGCGGMQLDCNDDDPAGACANDAGTDRDSRIARSMLGGESVLIRVSKFGPLSVGPFVLNITFSNPNDNCLDAIVVSPGAPAPFCTLFASTDGPTVPPCTEDGDNQINNDVWFRFTPTFPGRFRVSVCDAGFDTKLGVYGAFCASGLIACNDQSTTCPDLPQSSLVFSALSSGDSYLVRVGGYLSERGTGTVRISCGADFNSSGTVDATDIFIFLDAWFAQNGTSGPNLSADTDGSGTVDATDIFVFLDSWFAQNGQLCG